MTDPPVVHISQGPDWSTIVVRLSGGPSRFRSELRELLITYDAELSGEDLVIPALTIRTCASQLGSLFNEFNVTPEYDSEVGRLLQTHLHEAGALREASSLKVLDLKTLVQVLSASRFTRTPELKEHQSRALTRLLALKHGANFSVPGAGKTTTLLAVYEYLRVTGVVDRLVVVAPKNAFISWEEEIGLSFSKETPHSERLGGGSDNAQRILDGDPEIVLITYQFLPNFYRPLLRWAHTHRTHIVLDEAHRIKSGSPRVIAAAALSLAGVGERKDILTGTPLPQSPEDLRPQLEFIWTGQPILPDSRVGGDLTVEMLVDLQQRVKPLYVRTTHRELSLPKLTVNNVDVPMGPVQHELYELLRSEARRRTSGLDTQDRAYFRALGRHVVRLIEAASNPMLLTQNPLFDDDESDHQSSQSIRAFDLLREFSRFEKPAKVAEAIRRTRQALLSGSQRKVLIWTAFVQNILSMERLLSDLCPVVLYGDVATGEEEDPDTREGRIHRFLNADECQVMIANPAACGEGISLHQSCHYAIYLDRTFNAAHFLQSVDRIHRLGLQPGQETVVDVLHAKWTIDGRVTRRLSSKISAMSTILDDPGLAELAYDPEDVVEEFPAGLQPEDVDDVVQHLNVNKDDQAP